MDPDDKEECGTEELYPYKVKPGVTTCPECGEDMEDYGKGWKCPKCGFYFEGMGMPEYLKEEEGVELGEYAGLFAEGI